jgi:sugar lactone lactonase YvrE
MKMLQAPRISLILAAVTVLALLTERSLAKSLPVITLQPTNSLAAVGATVSCSVTATGAGPFTYQWYLKGTQPLQSSSVNSNSIITTVVGGGFSDGDPAVIVALYYPQGVTVDRYGNVYIAETGQNLVRKVATNGIISTVAGTGFRDLNGNGRFSGDCGAATNAELFSPQCVAIDTLGNLFFTDQANNRVRKVDTNGMITTVAGNGTGGFSGDGGVATNAEINSATGVAVDTAGNLYIADSGNEVIRKVDTNGVIRTVAGDRTAGYSGDAGSATNASLNNPMGVVVDGAGAIYIADAANNRIRRVGVNGIITTAAGNGTNGYSGDGSFATNAELGNASGVTLDAAGNLFVADTLNERIRKVDSNGIISTVAGNGFTTNGVGTGPGDDGGFSGDGGAATNAELNSPMGVAVDYAGNCFISDHFNLRIRKVDTNDVITTIAGNGSQAIGGDAFGGDGGPASMAQLNLAEDVATDGEGRLFVVDRQNTRIRKVDTNGVITTLAGPGNYGIIGDGGPATNALLFSPNGVTVDGAGNVYIADTLDQRIRKVNASNIITTVAGDGFTSSQIYGGYSGDNGPATNAELNLPIGAAVDSSGNLFIADAKNGRVRKVDTNGIITTFAGNLSYPVRLAFDTAGNLLIADIQQHNVRRVDTNGIISTVAGTGTSGSTGDGGAATNAELNSPSAIAADSAGNLYIADQFQNVIRRVDPQGVITTVVGNGYLGDGSSTVGGYSGDGGPAIDAELCVPTGLAVDGAGNLFIADDYNSCIRKVSISGSPVLTLPSASLANSGNYSVVISNPYGSVTSSVVSVTIILPPAVSHASYNPGSGLTLNLETATNLMSRLYSTTNLSPPVVWLPVVTNLNGGAWQFTDPGAAALSTKFYRISTP